MSRTATGALQDLLERHVSNGTAPGIVASLGTAAETEIAAAGLMAVGGAPLRDDADLPDYPVDDQGHHRRGRPFAWSKPAG